MVDDRGTVRVDDPRSAATAGLRPGRYRLLPAAADLLLLRRASDNPADDERVTLAGEIEPGTNIAEILNLIYQQRWDGALTLLQEAATRSAYFHQGNIRAVASTRPEERLESILYRFGLAGRTAIELAATEAGSQKNLARLLVERGIVSGADLYTALRRQADELVHALLNAEEGVFVFRRQNAVRTPGPLNLDTQSVLFESVRRLDELKYFRAKIDSAAIVLIRRVPAPARELESENDSRVLDLVDGHRTLDGIARESRLGEFEATKSAYHLLEAGFVDVAATPAAAVRSTPQSPVPSAVENALGRLVDIYNPYFMRIFRAAANKGREAALRSDLESFFRGSTGLAELFRGVEVSRDGTLSKERLLVNLASSRAPRKLEFLHQALSEFLYFLLFSAMEELDRQSEQELERRAQEILREPAASAR